VGLLKNLRFTTWNFAPESFNVFNHASFTNINMTITFNSAGSPTQGFGAVTASGPGRAFQLGLKLLS